MLARQQKRTHLADQDSSTVATGTVSWAVSLAATETLQLLLSKLLPTRLVMLFHLLETTGCLGVALRADSLSFLRWTPSIQIGGLRGVMT
jgi:hypothetical protein